MNRIPAQMIVTLIWMVLIPGHAAQAQIDYASFIESRKLNEKTILLTFGYDAVTAISAQQGIIVIDAGISNQLTAKFRETIEKEFSGNDFACLINTHSHHDHTGGNQVFSGIRIIAHENCPREMEQSQGDPEKVRQNLLKIVEEYETELDTLDYGSEEWKRVYYQKMRYQLCMEDRMGSRILTYPTETFSDSMTLDMGDFHFEMIWYGKAHSASDILIFIPESGILMSGDLFFPGGRPSLNQYEPEDTVQWLIAQKWLRKRLDKIELVVGGHGQIMRREDVESFLERSKPPTVN